MRGLDEKVKIPALVAAIRETFGEFGTILDVVAKSSIKRKGQAFVIYDSVDSAQEAVDELSGFELFGKQIEVDFAKTKSDVIVQRDEGEGALEEHKKHRVAEKGMSRLSTHTVPENMLMYLQSANKPSKPPKPSLPNVLKKTTSPNVLLRPRSPLHPTPQCRTSTCLRTRSSSCAISKRTTARTSSLSSSRASPDSRRCVWCQAEPWALRNTMTRLVRLRRRSARRGWSSMGRL